jgi:hypothetical protein
MAQEEHIPGAAKMSDVASFPISLLENHDFITDCARYAEGLLSEQGINKKHHFDDATWARQGDDKVLIEAVEAEKLRRVRSGDSARERAQQLFATATPRPRRYPARRRRVATTPD